MSKPNPRFEYKRVRWQAFSPGSPNAGKVFIQLLENAMTRDQVLALIGELTIIHASMDTRHKPDEPEIISDGVGG